MLSGAVCAIACFFCAFLSALNASILALSSVSRKRQCQLRIHKNGPLSIELLPGFTSSILSGARLNGSLGSLRRWDWMVDRSMDTLELGRITGSSIKVYIRGSINQR